jgi:hypothetical protein
VRVTVSNDGTENMPVVFVAIAVFAISKFVLISNRLSGAPRNALMLAPLKTCRLKLGSQPKNGKRLSYWLGMKTDPAASSSGAPVVSF